MIRGFSLGDKVRKEIIHYLALALGLTVWIDDVRHGRKPHIERD